MRTILVAIFLLFYFLLGLPVLGVEWIYAKINKEKAELHQLRIVQWAFRVIMVISGVKLEIQGEENIPKDEAVLYIGNHRGIFDVLATYPMCPQRTGYISKMSIKKVPFLRLWMKRLHCLFIDRDDIKQSLKVILAAIDLINEGISVCVFPEGTRCRDTEDPTNMLQFKEGTFKIALKTGCKIVPFAITGTGEILEQHVPWIRKNTVKLTYGAPIDPNSLDKEEQKRIGAYCQEVIHKMLVEQQEK